MFFGGSVTLKMVTQICFLLDLFVSSSYGLIFVIMHSNVWVAVSTLYFAQTLLSVILLLETSLFDLSKRWVYKLRMIVTVSGIVSLCIFYLL